MLFFLVFNKLHSMQSDRYNMKPQNYECDIPHCNSNFKKSLAPSSFFYCTISTGENTIPTAKSILYREHPCMSALHIFSPSHSSAALFSLFLCDDFLYGSLLPLQELRTMSSLGYWFANCHFTSLLLCHAKFLRAGFFEPCEYTIYAINKIKSLPRT